MPYTPPASQSPASSKTSSPNISRSNSYSVEPPTNKPTPTSPRPGLPRSVSSRDYLQKHRRSPSFSSQHAPQTSSTVSGVGTAGDGSSPEQTIQPTSESIRQSPPPVTDAPMPNGAILSPPESSGSSDDETSAQRDSRGRLVNLAELQEAVRRSIGLKRDGSPTRAEDIQKMISGLTLVTGGDSIHPTISTASTGSQPTQHNALTPEARKISHSRSTSENAFLIPPTQGTDSSTATSDDSDEDSDGQKPPLLRKKSGELVKPALRPSSSRRRYSSMPGTPTYSKAVHFNEDIEQVRHFLQVDRPIAVSAGTSPVETYDSESEYPFGKGDHSESQNVEWELKLNNFPSESFARSTLPVRVEKISLSADQKTLIGSVAVANIAFHKHVVARFTFDYWKTTSEILAEYNDDVRKKLVSDGCDRFNFSIKLADQANLENKMLLLCVRYRVDGQEFWDNNNHANFQIEFEKKSKKAAPKSGMQGLGTRPLNAIPRSRHSPPATARPRSMPASLDDDFANAFNDTKFKFGSPDLSDSPAGSIKLKRKSQNARNAANASGGGQNAAFAARYDFGASLAASLKNVDAVMGDRSGLKSRNTRKSESEPSGSREPVRPAKAPAPAVQAPEATSAPRPDAISSEKHAQNSLEYHELIQKYCFFGSSKSSQTPNQTKSAAQNDGGNDDESVSDGSTRSSTNNSPQMGKETSSYFDGASDRRSNDHGAASVMARSASPVPLHGSRAASPASFGYPYHSQGLFSESHTPTAIAL
ncbi:MAG: hypothetical protein M1822_007790 [Bathelium mastoideum]|nr:MAG: hypothetical protein M1822_007790 [Bathelium mastoideum]